MTINRRKALATIGLITTSKIWSQPLINIVVLPAHAQTSQVCEVDSVVGGPLIGHPSGASNCQDACEFEAELQDAQLCLVETTETSSGTDCSCELDLPGE